MKGSCPVERYTDEFGEYCLSSVCVLCCMPIELYEACNWDEQLNHNKEFHEGLEIENQMSYKFYDIVVVDNIKNLVHNFLTVNGFNKYLKN